jgi:hypothetical protein
MKRFLGALALASAWLAVDAQPLVAKPEQPDSAYTEKLARILKRWPSARRDVGATDGVELACIATADADAYVGTLRRARIKAPIASVEDVIDDVAHYKELFPDTVDVRVVSRSSDGARFVTAWEQRVPVFFLPNVTYQLSHLVDKSMPGRGVYRYKLLRSDALAASDGLVVLESVGPGATQLTEYGFFNALPNPLPASAVWREGVRAALISVLALKLRAENPSWNYARIAIEAERIALGEAARLDQCLADRQVNRLQED